MKVVCDRQALQDALAAATAVTPSRTPKPILQCVRLTAEKDALVVTAYDAELGLRYRLKEVETASKGETLVPADRLAAIVRESADETLTLETQADTLHVRGSDSHFQVFGQDPRQFPPVPDLEGEPDLRVRADVLKAAIERTIFAVAKESTRYAIHGVLFDRRGRKLQLVATDGRRLAKATAAIEKSVGEDSTSIVPTKALSTLLKLHTAGDEIIDVRVQPNQIIFRAGGATVSTVLLEGSFPPYDEVIPADCDKKIELQPAEFHSAVRRAALLTNEESRGVRLAISSDGIVLSSRAPEQGEATIRYAAKYSGPPVDIGFNPAFLVDALRVCGAEATLELKDSTKPGIFRSGPDFLYVLMPVNLS